ncbi:hypothetical protein FACS1894167_09010 [Synergistales bacterium]|nr:hypothetical protein FACS1894167_09010 [Synergistales bacterium]
MSIQSMFVENFTVFESLEMNFSDGINVFIGENGVGKTHLLKLLYAFCENEVESSFVKKLNSCMLSSNTIDSKDSSRFNRTLISLAPVLNDKGSSVLHIKVAAPPNKYLDVAYEGSPDNSYGKEKTPSAFIPAKEMLSHSGIEKDYITRKLPLDDTLIDILNKCGVSELRELSETEQKMIDAITRIIGGKVEYNNNKYYINRDGGKVGFSTESEGFKKFACIYRLIETGNLRSGSVLFWDEPEANINPKNIPALVKILFELQSNGVQVFLATHNYFVAKYLNLLKPGEDKIVFHALYKYGGTVTSESNSDFEMLDNNLIVEQSIRLYEEEVEKALQ